MFGGFSASKLKPRKSCRAMNSMFVRSILLSNPIHSIITHIIICHNILLFSIISPLAELKMAVSRIQIASNKKAALLKQNMREVAVMLSEEPPKEEKAAIRAEALVRDDQVLEAYEILQLECELLHERIKLIEYSKTCPSDLVAVVSTLMWASHRVDIPELVQINKQFRMKYGKKFEENALNNVNGVLNERVVMKLSVNPPAAYLVQTYLERICEQFEVDWKPKVTLTAETMAEPMAAPTGFSVPVAQGTGLGPSVSAMAGTEHDNESFAKSNGGIPPPVVTAEVVTPVPPPSAMSSVTGGGGGGGGASTADDFAEPDIYIPGPPSAPPGSGGKPSSSSNNSNNQNDDDDDENGIPPPAPGHGGGDSSSSYADLAARFDKLKK